MDIQSATDSLEEMHHKANIGSVKSASQSALTVIKCLQDSASCLDAIVGEPATVQLANRLLLMAGHVRGIEYDISALYLEMRARTGREGERPGSTRP